MPAAPTKEEPGADVQLEHGYLRLANKLATAVAMAPWDSPAQPRLVMALLRATYGLRRNEADLGTSTWTQLTGLTDKIIRRHRQRLQQEGVLILVRDFDARTSTPQRWRLRKDFTKWGAFAVPIAALQEAEKVAGELLKEAQTTATPPPARDPSPHSGGEVPAEGGEEGPPEGGGPPPTAGGRVRPNGVGAVGESGPERQRKDRKDIEREKAARGGGESEEDLSAVVMAANRGMLANPAIGEKLNPIPASGAGRETVREWLKAGVPLDIAAEKVEEVAAAYVPDRRRQITSMAYFTNAVHEEWERRQVAAEAGVSGKVSRSTAKLLRQRQEMENVDLNGSRSVFDD